MNRKSVLGAVGAALVAGVVADATGWDLDEVQIASAASATGLDAADIRKTAVRVAKLWGGEGEEIPVNLRGPKGAGTMYVRRVPA